jgi:nuclear transport factor 2 (NTF2) superfamily protein
MAARIWLFSALLLLTAAACDRSDQPGYTEADQDELARQDEAFWRQTADFDRQSELTDQQLEKLAEQAKRYDAILDLWERQSQRMDAILERLEQKARP